MIDSGIVRQQDNGHFSLTFSLTLHTPINEAWSALANEKERNSWFKELSLVAEEDGVIRLDFSGKGLGRGQVVSINKPTEIVHTIVWEDMPTSEVSWSFAQVDNENTMLVLTHQNLTSGALLDWAVGWHITFDNMVAYVEHKKAPLPNFEELSSYYSKQLAM